MLLQVVVRNKKDLEHCLENIARIVNVAYVDRKPEKKSNKIIVYK